MTAVDVERRPAAPPPAPPAGPGRGTYVAVLLSAAVLGALAGVLALTPVPIAALALPVLLVPVLLWKRPVWGPVLVFAALVSIEQYGYDVGPRRGTLTSELPFFHSVAYGTGIIPAELLLMVAVGVCILLCVRDGRPLVHWTPLARRIALFAVLAAIYFVVGISRGGEVSAAITELRPFAYLAMAYLLASLLLATPRAPKTLLWIVVVGCALKAAYGIVILLSTRTLEPRPEAVLSHEESFFFGLYVFVTLGAWLFDVRGRLRTVATVLLPIVIVADLVNSRRTAWAILIVGCALMLAVGYRALPARRHVLRRVGLVLAVSTAVYLPLFWNSGMTIAQPARAIRSEIAPDARDESSNEYRNLEDYNLELNIRGTSSTGLGFGIPIEYAIEIPDITDISSSLAYTPHNTIYWVWMRLGLLGQIVLWLVVAEALFASMRLARRGTGHAALLGAVTASAVTSWMIMAEVDLGLFWYRLALCMGILLGTVEAQTRLLPRDDDGRRGWPGAAARAVRSR